MEFPQDIAAVHMLTDEQIQSEIDGALEYLRKLRSVVDFRRQQTHLPAPSPTPTPTPLVQSPEYPQLQQSQSQSLQPQQSQPEFQPEALFAKAVHGFDAYAALIQAHISKMYGPNPLYCSDNVDWDVIAESSSVFSEFGIQGTQIQAFWDRHLTNTFEYVEDYDAVIDDPETTDWVRKELNAFYQLDDKGIPKKIGKVHPFFAREERIMISLIEAEPTVDKKSVISSLCSLMRSRWIVDDFNTFFADSVSVGNPGTWKTRWSYLTSRIESCPAAWELIVAALFGHNEVEWSWKLGCIADFVSNIRKKAKLDDLQDFTANEGLVWDTICTTYLNFRLSTLHDIVTRKSNEVLSSSRPSLPFLRELLLLQLCFIENYFGVPHQSADYFNLQWHQSPDSNYFDSNLNPTVAVYNVYKTAKTYGQYTHKLSTEAAKMIKLIYDCCKGAIFMNPHVLWDASKDTHAK
ncbi:hypothetical protein HDU81_009667 [Chytriomyces hyalinus]|nr:hypothetical protein HDU81_009667 [Chytriomyces hyalinus]